MTNPAQPLEDASPAPTHASLLSTAGLVIATVLVGFAAFYGFVFTAFKVDTANVVQQFFLLPALTAAGVAYLVAIRQVAPGDTQRIVYWSILFAVLTLIIPPFHSRDIYGYINRGWEQVHYGLNPYVSTISSIPDWTLDPMLTDHWVDNPSPYGFLFMRLTSVLCWLGGGNLVLTVILFKLFNSLVYGAAGWLIHACARRLGDPHPGRTLLLFLWNPLILLSQLACGHNDLVMGTMQLLAVLAMVRGAWMWVIPALTAGTLVKYGSLVLVPGVMAYIGFTQGWLPVLYGILISGLIVSGVGYSYLIDAQRFKLGAVMENGTVFANSPQSALVYLYRFVAYFNSHRDAAVPTVQDLIAERVIKLAFWGGFLVVFLAWCGRTAQRAQQMDVKDLLTGMVLVQFLLICVVSGKFYLWYLGSLLPMAMLLPAKSRLKQLLIWMSVTWLFAFTVIGAAHILNVVLMTGIPVAAVFVWPWIKTKSRQAAPQVAVIDDEDAIARTPWQV